ncbi:MAG: Peptidyl-tRNA hydrolase [Candidatus Uhrbacteria bacterium GW2011_GWA2_53_10]|uniref:Peptidyl-tRNA hydrolase n=1 Tax=Candidatus Uhrbacteria bacterium GW2011_GWA2_53_10 TaxID=1618980 RepID=A0A0G2AHM9_9BACT|nr:MAG: Peptidyl-tRNA hydrolase [Candidatus Uhrbacteria bacterium GW2011_GWA2_53_10]
MKLIVGLGNPGGQYESTRHNIGFMVVDKLSHELVSPSASWSEDKIHKAFVARAGDVILAKPLTFMNNSGLAVSALIRYYKLSPADLWVVHDDIDLPLGKIRIRENGGTGGHHGIESIIAAIKTDTFVRFRMGIGRGKDRSIVRFVLSHFSRNEAGELKHLVKHSTEAVRIALLEGLDRAQNRFH